MIKFAITTDLKNLFNYIVPGSYYVIETNLLFLTALFYKTLRQKVVAILLKYQKKIDRISYRK